MKTKGLFIKRIFSIVLIFSFCILLTSCLFMGNGDGTNSVVMVKNDKMSSYGTGFAIGVPGKPVEYFITSYSVVASANGAIPKQARIGVIDAKNDIVAEIVYCDIVKNVAILKASKPIDGLEPLYLTEEAVSKFNDQIHSYAYSGTGNLMSGYDKFNNHDLVTVVGSLLDFGEYSYTDTYLFTKEFNRAASGAPAISEDGRVIGMFAYSSNILDTENPQFILASYEIVECLIEAEIDFLTYEEAVYRNICIITVASGLLVILVIVLITVIVCKKGKKENNKDSKIEVLDKKSGRFVLKVTSGVLNGFSVVIDKNISVGRDPARCSVVYPVSHPGISGMHCTVCKKDDGIFVVDNYSKCGTFLADGTKLAPEVPHKVEGTRFEFYLATKDNTIEITQETENRK